MASLHDVLLQDICKAATWSSVHMFTTHALVHSSAVDAVMGSAVLQASSLLASSHPPPAWALLANYSRVEYIWGHHLKKKYRILTETGRSSRFVVPICIPLPTFPLCFGSCWISIRRGTGEVSACTVSYPSVRSKRKPIVHVWANKQCLEEFPDSGTWHAGILT